MAIQAQLYSENNIGIGYGFGIPVCVGSQDSTENGCVEVGLFNQFCFNVQQKQQHQQQQHQDMRQPLQNHQNQSLCFDNGSSTDFVSTLQNNESFDLSMPFSHTLALETEKQRQEIDYFLRSQNERLRLVLQEQRKQQLEIFLKKVEIKASTLLRQKDEEVAKATNRALELDILLKKLEMEGQAWRRIAKENEAMVFSLNNTLEQLKENASCCFNNGAEDKESCCDIKEEETEKKENREIGTGFGENKAIEEKQRTRNILTICKGCNTRDSCVLFLPCRHLCSCKTCAAFLDSCPVCLTPKKASIETLIF